MLHARRTLIQTLDRHYREELVNRPAIWKRLEEREVTEVFVGKKLIHITQLVWYMLHVLCQIVDFMAYTPIHCLNLSTCL